MKCWLILVALAWPMGAAGQFNHGGQLMDFSDGTGEGEPREAAALYMGCIGYLAGIAGVETAYVEWKVTEPNFCIEENVEPEQLRQVFLGYMNGLANDWHETAASLALKAFANAWICSEPSLTMNLKDLTMNFRDLHLCLGFLGYDAGPTDGEFSRETIKALAAFEKDSGKPNPLDVCKERGWTSPQ